MDPNDFLEAFTEFVKAIVQAETASLRKELALIKSLQDDWVNQKEAMRITGIKCPSTMKKERERKGTLLIVKYAGDERKMPRYLRTSLIAYNESKISRRIVGRILPMPPQID